MAKALKASNTIAFQGEPGANSDMACRAAFPYMTTLPCPTFEAAMAAVQAGKAELAIIPVENSIAGRVADLHSLLPHTRLKIVAEHFQRVEHCLVALPGATLEDHQDGEEPRPGAGPVPQLSEEAPFRAAGSCRHRGRGARDRRASATRAWAPSPRRWPPGSTISRCWRRNIEDADHNTTRMLVFSRDRGGARLAHGAVHDRLPVPGEERARPRSTRRWAALRPTASTS